MTAPTGGARRTPLQISGDLTRQAAGSTMIVDWASPLYVAGYLVLTFGVFRDAISPPGLVLSGVFPAAGVALLLFTPSERILRMPVCLPLIAYVGWNAASLLWSDSPVATFYLVRAEMLPLLVVTVVAATIPWRVLVQVMLLFFVWASVWNLLAGLFYPGSGLLAGGAPDDGLHATFGHKNDLGVFAVLGLAMVLPLYRGRFRMQIILLLVFTAAATRSATAGGGLATVLFVWAAILAVERGRSERDRQILRIAAFGLALIAILTTLRLIPVFLDLYDKDITFSGRTIIWSETLDAVGQDPWLGRGLGAVWTQAPTMLRLELWHRIGFPAAHAHNAAIQIMLDVGLIGLGFMVAFLISVGRLAFRLLRHPHFRPLAQWAFLVLITVLLTGLAEPLLGVPQIGLLALMWVVLASAHNELRGIKRPLPVTTL